MRKLALILSLIMCLGLEAIFAQTRNISGTVTGKDDGQPIPGASVSVKGTTTGTITRIDGKYDLAVPADATTLVFSFVGMITQEVAISGRTVINTVLEIESFGVDEVVVTALGIKREKRETAYQTQKVDDSELTIASPNQAAMALPGKVAGLQVNIQNNGVNPSTQILLRGFRSIGGNNSALIVIDGSIASQGAFDDLNPNDIESISVLKGATAAALYGSQAGNGALIVTTKSGKINQKFIAGVTSAVTYEKVAYMPDFQTEYGTGWEGAYDPVENTNWGPRFDGTMRQIGPTFPDGYGLATQMVPYAPVKDNLLGFYNTGTTLNNTVYVNGGSDDSKFYLSIGDQRTTGIVPDDEYQRNTFRANASKKLGDVELSVNSSFFSDKTDVVGSTIGDQDRPLYWFLLNTSANIPLSTYKDWQNPLSYGYADNYYNAYYQNPYWAVGTNRNIDYTSRFNSNVSLSWDITDKINFMGRAGANNAWGTGKNWRAAQKYNEDLQASHSAVSSFVEDTEFQSSYYNGDAILSGNFTLNPTLTLKGIVGANVTSSKYRDSEIRANNLSIPGFYDISNGTGQLAGEVDQEEKRTIGMFGDFTLGYKNYLFLNLTGRQDWTSTLPVGDNSYFYPSMGLSFVATDAFPELKNNDILSFAKFTLSRATVYNDLNPYDVNEKYMQSTGFPYGSVNGFYLSGEAVDAGITKEKLNTLEFGLNMAFFNNRLWADFAYFNTVTTNLITPTTPSIASASESFLTNIGELEGNGIELTIGGTVLKSRDFKWDVILNYASSETVVNEIYEGLDEIALQTTGEYGVYAVKGMAFPQVKANDYKRDSQGRVIVDPSSGYPLVKDGLFALGKTTPDYILGLNTAVSFKGVKLSATFDYRTGHVYYEQGSDNMEFTGRSMASVSANRQDFVVPNSVIETSPGVFVENTNIQVQNGRQGYWTDVYNLVKSNYVKDATALKLRELSLNYDLPKNLLANTPLSKVTVGFVGRNLLTWLPAENHFSDPEFRNTRDTDEPNAVGIGGYLQSPPTKSYGFSLNIEF